MKPLTKEFISKRERWLAERSAQSAFLGQGPTPTQLAEVIEGGEEWVMHWRLRTCLSQILRNRARKGGKLALLLALIGREDTAHVGDLTEHEKAVLCEFLRLIDRSVYSREGSTLTHKAVETAWIAANARARDEGEV